MAAPLRSFLRAETRGALAMLAATLVALVWANFPWPPSYESFWTMVLSLRIGPYGIS
jgi:Na+/H+ antiporter NhaA